MKRTFIIQVYDGGAEEVQIKNWGFGTCGSEKDRLQMKEKINEMKSGTFCRFGGGWILKDIEEST